MELRGSGAGLRLVDRVRAIVRDELSQSGASQARVARRCGMSVATLRRRLEQYDVRYRDLVSELQREVVMRALSEPDMGIEHICQLAGFTHKAAFYRAFRRWYGCTPAEYRRSLHLP